MMELPADELLDYLVSDDYLDAQRQQERNRDQPPAPLVEPATLERALIRAAPDPDGIRVLAAPTREGLAFLGKLLFTPRQTSKLADLAMRTAAYQIAALDPVKRLTPARRRRWWWPW
jgi:hypothetical protein